jgi:hypothetical protein
MVDFRKWLIALAAVGLLLGIGSSAANAQTTASFSCTTAASVNNIVRAEGIAELVGDLVLNCTGGTATAAGSPIPLSNVQVSLNTTVTSRIVDAAAISEALILIDDPYPTTGVPAFTPPGTAAAGAHATTQLGCVADNNTNCVITSVGIGFGAAGSYSGTAGHYNIFQGVQTASNAISWTGVPIDAPGTTGFTRIIRITNVRGDANQLGVVSSLIPTNILMFIAVNGNTTLSIVQPPSGNVVAQIEPGIQTIPGPGVALNGSYPPSPGAYQQCNAVNTYLATPPGSIATDNGIYVSATEGFAYAWRPQNFYQIYEVKYAGLGFYEPPGVLGGGIVYQDVPGVSYGTESGFMPLFDSGVAEPATNELVGLADRGTQLQFTVSGVDPHVTLYAPSFMYLTGAYGTATPVGVAVLVQAGSVSGAYATFTDIPVGYAGVVPGSVFTTTGLTVSAVTAAGVPTAASETAITASGTTATLVYEIYYSDPSVQESLSVPISVSYAAGAPASTTTPSTVTVAFSPQNTSTTPSVTTPIPRFAPSGSPLPFYTISSCTCDLLFPFVTTSAGFDTGIAIANTSADPFGTVNQSGTVTLTYYASNGSTPPGPYTSNSIAAGQELVFDAYSGNTAQNIQATANFTGYVIASANFQYCHGFAFISDLGAQKLAEGYLAIVLNPGGLVRGVPPLSMGENLAH